MQKKSSKKKKRNYSFCPKVQYNYSSNKERKNKSEACVDGYIASTTTVVSIYHA